MSTEKPSRPGHYIIGCLYYPEHGIPQTITDIKMTSNKADWEHPIYADDVMVWFGPIHLPKIAVGTMTRLKREQAKAFVQAHEKHCTKCGAVSGVNSRSMQHFDAFDDCKKCGEQLAVEIRQKKTVTLANAVS